MVEVELGFAYDVFYTKASFIYTTSLFTCRGGLVSEEFNFPELKWTTSVEFDQSILIWHMLQISAITPMTMVIQAAK